MNIDWTWLLVGLGVGLVIGFLIFGLALWFAMRTGSLQNYMTMADNKSLNVSEETKKMMEQLKIRK